MKMYVSAASKKLSAEEVAARRELALNSTNTKLLTRLALVDTTCYDELTRNPNTPGYVLNHIAKESSDFHGNKSLYLLGHILGHPNSPEDLKQRILDSRVYISERGGLRKEFGVALAENTDDPDQITWLSTFEGGPSCIAEKAKVFPDGMAFELGLSPNTEVRDSAANNPNMDPDVLEILAYDPALYVRQMAILNPNISEDVFIDALNECPVQGLAYGYVRGGLLGRLPESRIVAYISRLLASVGDAENTDYQIAKTLCYMMEGGNISLEQVEEIASADFASREYAELFGFGDRIAKEALDILERGFVAKDLDSNYIGPYTLPRLLETCTAPEFLSKCAEDHRPEVRLLVAKNVNTPTDILKRLLNDRSTRVKKAAKLTLIQRNESYDTPSEAPKSRSTTHNNRNWSIPVFDLDSYAAIAPELDAVIKKVMNMAANSKLGDDGMAELGYEFDTDDYDTASTFTIRKNLEPCLICDAQILLGILTSVQDKSTAIKNGVAYLNKLYARQGQGERPMMRRQLN